MSSGVAASTYALVLATQLLQDPNGIPHGVPFTLSCCDCDSGHPESYEQAVAAGFIDIRFVPQSEAENFLDTCPQALIPNSSAVATRSL